MQKVRKAAGTSPEATAPGQRSPGGSRLEDRSSPVRRTSEARIHILFLAQAAGPAPGLWSTYGRDARLPRLSFPPARGLQTPAAPARPAPSLPKLLPSANAGERPRARQEDGRGTAGPTRTPEPASRWGFTGGSASAPDSRRRGGRAASSKKPSPLRQRAPRPVAPQPEVAPPDPSRPLQTPRDPSRPPRTRSRCRNRSGRAQPHASAAPRSPPGTQASLGSLTLLILISAVTQPDPAGFFRRLAAQHLTHSVPLREQQLIYSTPSPLAAEGRCAAACANASPLYPTQVPSQPARARALPRDDLCPLPEVNFFPFSQLAQNCVSVLK